MATGWWPQASGLRPLAGGLWPPVEKKFWWGWLIFLFIFLVEKIVGGLVVVVVIFLYASTYIMFYS